MPIIKMPDGQNVDFPNDMPPAEINAAIFARYPELAPKPGLLDQAKQLYENATTDKPAIDSVDLREAAHNKEELPQNSPVDNSLATINTKALTDSLLKLQPGAPMSDAEQAQQSMANTSDFLRGSNSPLLADQAKVNISSDQALSNATDAATRAADRERVRAEMEAKPSPEDQRAQDVAALSKQTAANDLPYVAAAYGGLVHTGANMLHSMEAMSDFLSNAYVNPWLNAAGISSIPDQKIPGASAMSKEADSYVSDVAKLGWDKAQQAGKLPEYMATQVASFGALGAQMAFSVANPAAAPGLTASIAAQFGGGTYASDKAEGIDTQHALADSAINASLGYATIPGFDAASRVADRFMQAGMGQSMAKTIAATSAKIVYQSAASSLQMGAIGTIQNASSKYVAGKDNVSLSDNLKESLFLGAVMGVPHALGHVATGIADVRNQAVMRVANQTVADRFERAAQEPDAAKAFQILTEKLTPAEQIVMTQRMAKEAAPKPADVLDAPDADAAIDTAIRSTPKQSTSLLANLDYMAGIVPSESPAMEGTAATSPSVEQQAAPNKPGIAGHSSEIVLPDNTSVPSHWEVVDADQVSATMQQGKNQPRDRTRAAASMQVQNIAKNPNYTLLRDAPVMDFGAPTLSQDGAIVGGNGRFEGVSRAYDQGTANDYRSRMEADAASKGIDPASFADMGKPVLVRRITQPMDTGKLAVASNSGGALHYSALEQARIDGDRMKGLGDVQVDDNGDIVTTGDNMQNIKRALNGYTAGEYGSLTDKEGNLSQEGMRRFKNAILYKAYGDSPVLSRLVESTDPDMKNIMGALTKAAGSVANVRSDIESGKIPKEYDLTPELMDAVNTFSKLKANGVSVDEHLAQSSLLGKEHSDQAAAILDFLSDNVRSQRRMAETIKSIYDGIAGEDHSTENMFGEPASKEERLKNAIETNQKAIAQERGSDSGVGAEVGREPETAQDRTASLPESEQAAGVTDVEAKAKADADFKSALNEAGAYLRSLGTVKHIIPEEHEKFMPILVKLFDAAFRKGYYDLKEATRYVRAELSKLGDDIARRVKFMPVSLMERAAKEAMANAKDMEEPGLFAQKKESNPEYTKVREPEEVLKQHPAWKIAENKKELIDESGMIRGLRMSDRERDVEQRFYDAILSDIHGAQERYRKVVLKPEEGLLVDPDRVKELSDDFNADKSLANAVHEPSSYAAKEFFKNWLEDNIDRPAVLTAGGGGSGKTEAMDTAKKVAGVTTDGVIFDSTLSNFNTAVKKIEQVIKAGGKVEVLYTNTPIDKAFDFASGRPRVVRITTLAEAHKGASDTFRMLEAAYKDNPNVELIVINNFGERHEMRQGNVDELPHYVYDETVKRLYESAKEKLASGKITQERFNALTAGYEEGGKQNETDTQQGTTQQGTQGSLGSLQEGKSGGKQERLAGRPLGDQEGNRVQKENLGYQGSLDLGGQNEHEPSGVEGNAIQGTETNGAIEGQRISGSVREGQDRGNIVANDLPSNADRGETGNGQGAGNAENSDLQQRGAGGAGDNSERGIGVSAGGRKPVEKATPAGADIPTKSGLNYHFTDADLDYKGSWLTKATQNVEAVELIKKLESEQGGFLGSGKTGRQATRDEQAVLAKFIGWGASDIRNKIFDPEFDKKMELLDNYDEAMEAMGSRSALYRSDYSNYYKAFNVIKANNKEAGWYNQSEITRAALEKAKPDQSLRKWADLRERVKNLMTDEEWASAERSTQYAHYTGKEVVNEMWRAIDRFGFKGGSILEPGAGIGIFPGLMDHAMANNSIYTGIEFEPFTGKILKQLLPDERILIESYVDSSLPNNFYDVAIGNPPFSATKILSDPAYKKNAFALHDYFFAKTMDKVKPGGLVMFVTSRYTMDKQGDAARQYLAERADLLGAIRLPETSFKKNAGTEVVTDILFLRKKVPGETFQGNDWINLGVVKAGDTAHAVNEYFVAHPEMVLGEHATVRGRFSKTDYSVTPFKDTTITELLAKAVDSLPKDVFSALPGSAGQKTQIREIDWNPLGKKEGSYYLGDKGQLMQVEQRVGVPAERVSAKDAQVVKDYIPLRDALNQAHYDQLNGGDWEKSLKTLQEEYKKFVAKNGQVMAYTTLTRTRTIEDEEGVESKEEYQIKRFDTINKLKDDPEHTKLFALENVNPDTGEITEGDVLSERVLDMPKKPRIDTPHDAMLSVLDDTGKVDIPMIAERMGLSEHDVIESLGSSVYKQPDGNWTTDNDYLSGNVKKKLAEAKAAAETDRNFERNVKALEEVIPAPKTPSNITVGIGSNWIPTKIYEEFLRDVAGSKVSVKYNEILGSWSVDLQGGKDETKFGTDKRDASSLLEHALTGRPVRITSSYGADGKKLPNPAFDAGATELANQKLAELRAEFKQWVWKDPSRTDELVRLFNDKFNTNVDPKFNGDHLTLPGTTSTIEVFNHVKRGAMRIIQTGNTYLAHAVGAGKTWEMVISAMEQKRLGMINKPMFVVPNHMLQQFAQEWLQLYPAARLMVADETQFHKDNRQRFISRAAMSDLDGIIITHSAFKILDIDPKFKQKMLNEEIAQMEAARDNAMSENGEDDAAKSRNPKVRQIQAQIEQLEEKLKASMNGEGKDKNVRFDEMGADMLYVDEAHLYRKLNFSTARQVKGISPTGSEYSRDLHMKVRWLDEQHPGRSLVMASGTPVTNTLAELYTVQRFMNPRALDEKGLHDFDAWASMFGEESTEIEADAAGKYANVTRFSKFVNVSQLTQMFRQYADVLTSNHLAEILGDERPKVNKGARKLIVTPEVADYMDYKKELAQRLEKSRAWKPSPDEPNNPDPIIRIIGDGRLAAIDMRFIHPDLPSDPNSKLNQMADGVIKVYQHTKDEPYLSGKGGKSGNMELNKGSAQMVFSDLGFGAGVTESRGFDARSWFINRLVQGGIPRNKIAFMSDMQTSEEKVKLFKDVNKGKILVLVGSSKNMGTGVNAQQRLIALHHLDTPWYPADLEQREGRIVRQGNKNSVVRIYAYSTKGSYDTVMWQLLARKQGFIDQALSGDSHLDTLDDISEVSQFQMATAMTAGDERAIRLAGLKSDLSKYERMYQGHEEQRARSREQYQSANYTIKWAEGKLPDAEALASKVQDLSGNNFKAIAGGKEFTARKEWAATLLGSLKDYTDHTKEGSEQVGEISGFPVNVFGHVDRNTSGKVIGYNGQLEMKVGDKQYILARDPSESDIGMSLRATNALAAVRLEPDNYRQTIADNKSKANALQSRLDTPFQFSSELAATRQEAAKLEAEMMAPPKVALDKEDKGGELAMFSRAQPSELERQARMLQDKMDMSDGEAAEMIDNGYRVDTDTGDVYRDPEAAGKYDLFAKTDMQKALAHTKDSLKASILAAHEDRDQMAVQALFDSGKMQIINEQEAERILGKQDLHGNEQAFYDPDTQKTYFVSDFIDKDTPESSLAGLVRHEIAVHALKLGQDSAEFQSILRQVEMMRKSGNAKILEAYDHVPADTQPGKEPEEALAYLTQYNPDLPVIKRVIAWFRNAIRAMGKGMPFMQRTKLNDWANKLDDNDLIYMAQTAMAKDYAAKQDHAAALEESKKHDDNLHKGMTPIPEGAYFSAKLHDVQKGDIYEVQPDTASNLPIDEARLKELRRAAALIESPEKGITFTVRNDGKAVVTGQDGTKVPARFQKFANDNGLTLVVQRSVAEYTNASAAMPINYRESDALYFGEIGSDQIDRTGKTRFSKLIKQGAPIPAKGGVFDKIKDIVTDAKDKFDELKDAYSKPAEFTDSKRIIGEYTGALQEIDFNLTKLGKMINAEVPKSRQEAITNYLQAGGDEALLRQRAAASHKDYKQGYDDALTLTPKEKAIAQMLRDQQDTFWKQANEAGILESYVENYVRGQWERENDAGEKIIALANSGMLNDKPREAMHKVFQNYFEGEQLGYVPTDKRIGYQFVAAQRSIRSAIAARKALTELMASVEPDGRPTVAVGGAGSIMEKGEEAQPYFVKPNVKAKDTGDYRFLDHPALRKWKWVGADTEGTPILLQGNMWIHPDAYGRINALLGKSWIRTAKVPESVPVIGGTRPGDAMLKMGGFIKGTLLVGVFHQFHLAEHAVFHNTNPFNTPEIDFDKRPVLREGVNHGLMLYNHNAMQEFGEGLASGGLWHHTPVVGHVLKTYQEWLFQNFIPRLKARMFEHAVDRATEYYKKDLADGTFTRDQLIENAAKQANAAFGELNYKYMGRNPTYQDGLRIALLAPDFLEARFKFAGQALMPKGKEQAMALIRGAMIMAGGAQLINMMFGDDHKTHWDRPFSVIIGGREYSPRSVVGDIQHLIMDPRGFWFHRINPLWGKPIYELGTGRDINGQKETIEDGAKNILKSWVPIPAQGIFKNNQGQTQLQSVTSFLLQSIGVSNFATKSPAEKLIADINFDRRTLGGQTQHEKDRYQAYAQLRDDYMSGKLNSMDDVVKAAKESNFELTKPQYKQIYLSRGTEPIVKQRMNEHRMKGFSAEEVMQTWAKMSSEEKDMYRNFALQKVARSQTLSPHEKLSAIDEIQKINP